MSEQPGRPAPSKSSPNHAGIILVVAAVVVAVVVGFVAIGLLVSSGSNASTPIQRKPPAPTTSPNPPAGHTETTPVPTQPSTSPTSALPALHCSKPPPAPGKGRQFSKPPSASLAQNTTWRATLKTNCGTIVMDLDGKAAPQTVSSFIFLSQKGFYDDSPCHRLTTPSQGLSVLQCGDPTGTGTGGPGYGYGIENAPKNGEYPTGTVAMARTSDPNSNGSQFFIVYRDTPDGQDDGSGQPASALAADYTLVGHVTIGIDVVQKIAAGGIQGDTGDGKPKLPVNISTLVVTAPPTPSQAPAASGTPTPAVTPSASS
jgi:peptidyl-prolyl cis-trans isomerase B (cyclophilin B)